MEYGSTPEHEEEQGYQDVKTLLSWTAPGRPFRKKGREFYLSSMLIFLAIEVIAFLFGQFQLMLAVAAITFPAMALATVAPKNFHYRISTQGVKIEDHYYIWEELYDFYFKRIDHVDTLIIRTEAFIPGELKLTMGNIPKDHARRILVNFLPYREYVKESFMERAGNWLSRNFPLDRA